MADVQTKAKRLPLKKTLKAFQQETFAEQSKLDRGTGSKKKTGSAKSIPKKTTSKPVSSQDLHEFEDLSQAVEKRFNKMGLAASAAVADEPSSSDDSDEESWLENKSRSAWGKRNLKSGKMAKIASHVVRRQF